MCTGSGETGILAAWRWRIAVGILPGESRHPAAKVYRFRANPEGWKVGRPRRGKPPALHSWPLGRRSGLRWKADSAWASTWLTQPWIWLGWTPNSSASAETASLPAKWRRTISGICWGVKCLRVPFLMESTSARVAMLTRPAGDSSSKRTKRLDAASATAENERGVQVPFATLCSEGNCRG